jgi:polysaccharide export outer membrane protein
MHPAERGAALDGRPTGVTWFFTMELLLALTFLLFDAAHAAQGTDYVIGPQDVLQISVFDQADLGGKYTVEADGTFTFPLVGRVKAAGLTLRAFELHLRKLLADGFFKNPQLSVAVEEYRSQRVFIVGEVRQPGTYTLTGGMTLIEALARAGSTMPSASGEALIVRARQAGVAARPVVPAADGKAEGADVVVVDIRELQSGALAKNVELRDGDTIYVPQAETMFVFGEVRTPGSYPLRRNTTVLQALSLAGGATEYAALGRIKTIRVVNGKRAELKSKLDDLVRAGDTITVPRRYF